MMPLLFVGHGNPMYAIEKNNFTETWRNLGESLPTPKAILVISAHWETDGTCVTAMENPPTIHDFYGFPQALFDVNYTPPGQPALAQQISKKISAKLDYDWGLDHGAWSVLTHIFPEAKVPVLQLSLDKTKNAAQHYELSQELQFLRDEGVLIIGSGNIVHNLRLINFRNGSGSDWANSANEVLKRLILGGNHESLISYQNLGEEIRLAIPSLEHFLPLIYILGLKKAEEKIEVFNDIVELNSISMTSFLVTN